MRALHKQLQIAEKVKSRVEEELKETTQTLAQLKVSHLSLHSSENKTLAQVKVSHLYLHSSENKTDFDWIFTLDL